MSRLLPDLLKKRALHEQLVEDAKRDIEHLRLEVKMHEASMADEMAMIIEINRVIAALEPPAEAAPEPDEQASAQPDPAEGTPVPGAGEESRDQLCSVEECEIHADDASEFAEEGYAPVVEAEPEAIGYFISEGQSIELRSDGTTAPLTPIADPIWNGPSNPEANALASIDRALGIARELAKAAGVPIPHSSDCALHNGPALEPEPCSCGADPGMTPEAYGSERPTSPEADFSAKAHDYYDAKAMAERDRLNPFNIFRKEGDQ